MRHALDTALLLALLATVLLWRFLGDQDWAGWLLLGTAVCVSLAVIRGCLDTGYRLLALLAGAAAVLSLLFVSGEITVTPETGWPVRFFAALWPCDLACSGVGPYGSVFGIPTWAPGLLAYAAVAVTAVWGERWYWPLAAQLLAWACVGCSLYFLLLSLHLGLVCPHCLAVHGIVLCFVAGILRGDLGWLHRLGSMVLAALVLHAAFHPFLSDAPPPTLATGRSTPAIGADDGIATGGGVDAFMAMGREEETTPASAGSLTDAELLYLSRADRGRRIGVDTAPWQAEFVVTLTCPHCEKDYRDLMRSCAEPIAAGRLQVVVRHKFWHQVPKDRFLARLSLAAAARGEFTSGLFAILGTPERLDRAAYLARIGRDGMIDAEALAREAEIHARPLDRLLDIDLRRLHDLLRRKDTPLLRVTGPAWPRGRIWQGQDIDFAEIAAAIARAQTPRD